MRKARIPVPKSRKMARGGRTRPKKYPHGGAFDGGYCDIDITPTTPAAHVTDCQGCGNDHVCCEEEWGCIWIPPSSLPQRPQRLRPQTQRRMAAGGKMRGNKVVNNCCMPNQSYTERKFL